MKPSLLVSYLSWASFFAVIWLSIFDKYPEGAPPMIMMFLLFAVIGAISATIAGLTNQDKVYSSKKENNEHK